MADFDPMPGRSGRRADHFARNLIVLSLVIGIAALAAFLLLYERPPSPEPPAAPTPTPTEPATPAPDVSPMPAPPDASPDASPDATPGQTYAQQGSLHVLAFRVSGSLSASIRDALPAEYQDLAGALADRLADALRWRLDVRREVQRGDLAKIVFNPAAKVERVPLYGFWYKSRRLGKELFYVYYPQAKGAIAPYYDAKGLAIAETLLRPPLPEAELQSATIENLGASGLFFAVRRGVDVNAPFPARVLRLNWDLDRLGRSIEVRYLDSGVIAWFGHLDAVSDRVKEGAMLSSGDVIAMTGNTGKTSRAGLLYRTFRSKDEGEPEPISPLDIHEKARPELAAADRVNFVAIRAKVEQLFALVDAAPAPSP